MSTFAFIVYDVIYKIINKTYTTEKYFKKKKKRIYNSWKQINNLDNDTKITCENFVRNRHQIHLNAMQMYYFRSRQDFVNY